MPINLVVSNKPSLLNKKLIKFFDLNLKNLNQANIIFDFEVAHPKNADEYKGRGITNYPVLVTDTQEMVIGVEKIMIHLEKMVNAHHARIAQKKTTGATVDDFWKQTLGNTKVNDAGQLEPESDSDDEDMNRQDNMQHRIKEAFEQRETVNSSMSKPKNNVVRPVKGSAPPKSDNNSSLSETPAETLANMQTSGGNSMDDALMAKFFENQEETL